MAQRVISLLAAALLACSHPARPDPFAHRNVITEAELEKAGAASAYDVVARTHAEFFRDRGRTSLLARDHARPVVFLNDVEYGVIETLRNIPASRLHEIRFYSGTEAAAKFGSAYSGGVIQLISRVE
jgi:hypothetical protein